MVFYGNKLKGLTTKEAVNAIKYALAHCKVVSPATYHVPVSPATYHAEFVPFFMAHLGLKDVKGVPSRRELDSVWRSHLAKQKEETTKEESETCNNSRVDSDSESSISEKDADSESDGFVGSDSDDDAAAAASNSALVASCPALRRRGVPNSADDLRAEKMAAPVRAALNKAVSALEKASRDGRPTRRALSALGFSGGVLLTGATSYLDDKPCAIKYATLVLPKEHGLDFERMPTGRAAWAALFKYHGGLGDGVLQKQIAATRECCEERKYENHFRDNNKNYSGIVAAQGALLKRKQEDQAADVDAENDLKRCNIFDKRGARPGASTPFGRVLVPSQRPRLGDVRRIGAPVWAKDAKTGDPIIVKCGPKLLKVAMCSTGSFELGIGQNPNQAPIGSLERTGPAYAAVMVDGAWGSHRAVVLSNGGKVSHRGRRAPGALLIDVSQKALTWANGGDDNPFEALSELGMSIGSSDAVVTAGHGTLHQFQHVCFDDTGGIPGGFEGLEQDYTRLMAMMRAAADAHGGDPGSVRLAHDVPLEKLTRDVKTAAEANLRLNICIASRCAGAVNDATLARLNWLKSEGFDALHSVADAAARLGHVQVRVLSYAHAAAGNFHFDSPGDGLQYSKNMAAAAAAADPANLDSLNFSLENGPVPARMGPAQGPA